MGEEEDEDMSIVTEDEETFDKNQFVENITKLLS